MRTCLSDLLRSDGHRVIAAESLGQALQDRDWKRFSAVIMELTLADGNAVQWFSRAGDEAAQIPVLILSDDPGGQPTLAALDAGAFDFVLKPIQPAALRACLRRITERRRTEQRLAESESRHHALLAGLAHESRNAFQRSQACLEMLALELEDQPEALELVERIQRAQDHLHYIYEEVRSYAAPIQLQLRRIELNQIWRDTWAHLEMLRTEKNVRLQEEPFGMMLTCEVDPIALEQVFRNILENAIDASPEGDTITILCRRARIGERPAVQVAIVDRGPGFTTDARQKVFEPFYTTKTRGTGLGMAIAHRLVEAHGGEISVGDAFGGGAEVRITLPCD